MKFSYSLLKQFVSLKIPPQKLGELLSAHSCEVEGITAPGGDFKNIFAAEVVGIQKHPNADRLRVVKLDAGDRIIEPVVCGAFNFGVGDIVALALPGAEIKQNIHSETHEPFILQKAIIRGVESRGMICAAFELGLSDSMAKEILVLDKKVKPGTPLNEIFPADDYVLNIALPANRSDLHSHLGLAREIAAVLNLKFKEPAAKPPKLPWSGAWKATADKSFCPKFYAAKLSGMKVGPSPKFIRDELLAVGQRPINNVVDITNYIMVKYGQPTHAYDAAKINGNLTVRRAREKEKFVAINHKTYELNSGMFVIADEQKTIALGGMIGGLQSEINQNTKEIIFEVANFSATITRFTSKQLGFKTDGSAIWEKGVHPNLADLGLAEGLKLLQEYAGAKIAAFAKFTTPVKKPLVIKFTADEINRLLGTNLKANEIVKYLNRYKIESKIINQKSKIINSLPPWWRQDITAAPDLSEEVLKLYGYNKVPPRPLDFIPPASNESSDDINLSDNIYQAKQLWARLGYSEVQNYNFVSQKDIVNLGEDPKTHVKIQNPLSQDQGYMRRGGLAALLKNVHLNQKYFDSFKLFEIGRDYFGFENEPLTLTAVLFDKHGLPAKLLTKAKGAVVEFFKAFGHRHIAFKENGKEAKVYHHDQALGGIQLVSPAILKNFDIESGVIFVKLDLQKILQIKKDILYQAFSKFPSVKRDLSIIVASNIQWQSIENAIRGVILNVEARRGVPKKNGRPRPAATPNDIAIQISLFEADFLAAEKTNQKFHEDLAKQGKKNFGIRLIFKAKNRTLTEAEVAGILDQIVLKLQGELKAQIR